MIKRERAITSTASNLVTSIITIFTTVVTGVIVTRALGPELKGQYMGLKLVSSLYASFLVFGYHGGVLYYGIRREIVLERFFWTGWIVMSCLSLAIVFVLFPLIKLGLLGDIAVAASDWHIALGLAAAPLILLNAYCERVIRSYHLFRASNVRAILGGLATLIYYVVLLLVADITLTHALVGIVVGQSVQLLLNLYFSVKYVKVSWSIEGDAFRPFRYGVKNWVNQILHTSNDKLDQIVLTFLLSASSFGIYTAGVGLSNLLTLLPTSYVNVFYNQIVTRETNDAVQLYVIAQRVTFLITLVAALCLAVLAYPLILILYGSPFVSAALVVAFYTPGLVFQVAARLSVRFYAARGKPLKVSLVYVAGLVVSLPFYFLLIPKYGINGAAISSSIAYFSAFMFSFYQVRREFGVGLIDVFIMKRSDVVLVKRQLGNLPVLGRYFQGNVQSRVS